MSPRHSSLAKALPLICGVLALWFLLYSANVLSRNAGLWYDELWDLLPAVGMIRGHSLSSAQEVKISSYPFPLVTGPYQGALKTWISAPVLAFFGTTPRFTLSLNAVYAVIYLCALYWALLPILDCWYACLVFALPFFDTSLLITAPMDTGPSIFQYIFLSFALGSLFRELKAPSPRHARLAWLFIGCLLAQKLTALPIVISLAVFAGFFSFRHFLASSAQSGAARAAGAHLLAPMALFAAPLAPHALYFVRQGFGDLAAMTATDYQTPYLQAIAKNFNYFCRMFDGSDWYRRMTLDTGFASAETAPWLAATGLAAAAISLALWSTGSERKKYGRYSAACTGIGICSFLLYPVFRGLDRPWHFYVLAPVFACSVMVAASHAISCLSLRSGRFGTLVRAVAAICVTAGILLGMSHGIGILRRFEASKGAGMASPALYDAYRIVQAADVRELHALNYSLGYPLYFLSKGRLRVDDLAFTTLTQEKIGELFRQLASDRGTAVIYRFCNLREMDGDWIRWLNREPEIFEFIARTNSMKEKLRIVRCRDERQTEFVLIQTLK